MNEQTKQKLYQIADGVAVEEDVLRIAEKVHEFDPNLRVKFNPDPDAGITEAPFRVTEVCRDGVERIVFDVWELDDRVLQRLYKADNLKFDIAGQLDRNNALARLRKQRRFEEIREEAKDIVGSVAKSSKDLYVVRDPFTNKKVKFGTHNRTEVVDNGNNS